VKRPLIEWEKIFANHMPDESLISRIYKEVFKKPTIRRQLNFKMVKGFDMSPKKTHKWPIST